MLIPEHNAVDLVIMNERGDTHTGRNPNAPPSNDGARPRRRRIFSRSSKHMRNQQVRIVQCY